MVCKTCQVWGCFVFFLFFLDYAFTASIFSDAAQVFVNAYGDGTLICVLCNIHICVHFITWKSFYGSF